MSTLFDHIGSWLQNLSPLMAFLVILWVVTIVVFRKAFTARIKNFDFKKLNIFKKSKELKKIHLLKDHDLFNVVERVRSEVRLKKFYTAGEYDITKSKMFTDFMNFYLDSIRDSYKKFFEDKSLNSKNPDELKTAILILMNTTEKRCAEQTKEHFLTKGIPLEDTEYIIRLFEIWRNETSRAVTSRINGIFSSAFHFDNFEKLLGCMEVMSMSIDLIPKDGVESFEKMNGRFINLTY
jgi:hypothetical protein